MCPCSDKLVTHGVLCITTTCLSYHLIFSGEEKEILVEHDDGIRPDISAAALGKLKAVFKKDGTTTAGNSSQVWCLHKPATHASAEVHRKSTLSVVAVLGACAAMTYAGSALDTC